LQEARTSGDSLGLAGDAVAQESGRASGPGRSGVEAKAGTDGPAERKLSETGVVTEEGAGGAGSTVEDEMEVEESRTEERLEGVDPSEA
ncbi:unnamed protein product, partial [Scytosiphon promiscuus]